MSVCQVPSFRNASECFVQTSVHIHASGSPIFGRSAARTKAGAAPARIPGMDAAMNTARASRFTAASSACVGRPSASVSLFTRDMSGGAYTHQTPPMVKETASILPPWVCGVCHRIQQPYASAGGCSTRFRCGRFTATDMGGGGGGGFARPIHFRMKRSFTGSLTPSQSSPMAS